MEVNGYKIGPKANLCGADLGLGDLRGANLWLGDLSEANLRGADLSDANLRGADLRWANLSEANLRRAGLRCANLRCANLRGADLSDAYLRGADLRGADLSEANLRGADLSEADLRGADLPHFQIPEGTLVGWKKLQGRIIRLSIPAKAKRTASLVGRKCRAQYAIVKEIDGGKPVRSSRGDRTEYRVGTKVVPDGYDDDARVECTNGIHFFLTRREAEEW